MINTSVRRSLRIYQIIGLAGLILVLGSIGGWAALASIQGAVIASGTVVVESHVKRVQHREGGIVSEIHVEEGDRVKAGDILVRLDETDTRAELAVIESTLDELTAKRARLVAERDKVAEPQFPVSLVERSDNSRVAEMIAGQVQIFTSQRASLEGRKEQLTKRIGQLDQQIDGLRAQIAANKDQMKFVSQELGDLKELHKQGLVRVSRIHALERERARLEGQIGELVAEIARAETRIGETQLQMITLEDDAQTKVLADLRDTEARISELEERRLAAQSRLSRMQIRAPRAGWVHQLNVHTVAGVIGPGETIMQIVPDFDELVVEARVRPADIDKVAVGQPASMRFSAFSTRTTPHVIAEVIHVSADLTHPADGSPPYYTARLRLGPDQLKLLGDVELKPGMPVESFIETEARTPLSYLLKPLSDQIARTFRET